MVYTKGTIDAEITDGQILDEVVISLFVTKKLTEQDLRDEHIEPVSDEVDGYKTDVLETPQGFQLRNGEVPFVSSTIPYIAILVSFSFPHPLWIRVALSHWTPLGISCTNAQRSIGMSILKIDKHL
jgi:hypothetical protein